MAPDINRLVDDFSRDVVGPHGPRERRHVEEGYRDLVMPCRKVEPPALFMQAEWDATAVLGYLDTWSAVRRHRARTGRNALALVAGRLESAWGGGRRSVIWPLAIRAGRV